MRLGSNLASAVVVAMLLALSIVIAHGQVLRTTLSAVTTADGQVIEVTNAVVRVPELSGPHGTSSDSLDLAVVRPRRSGMSARSTRTSFWLEALATRLQVSAPGIEYGDFMKLSASERRACFDSLTAENRARIVQTHVKRWLDKNRRHLTAGELAVFEEIVAFLSPELSRTSDGASDKRQDALQARVRCRVAPEDVSAATNVFGEARNSLGQKAKRSYLKQAKCWIDWVIEEIVDYVPDIGR